VNDQTNNDDHITGTEGPEVTRVTGLLLVTVIASLVLLLI
jgi:hypothetical protein